MNAAAKVTGHDDVMSGGKVSRLIVITCSSSSRGSLQMVGSLSVLAEQSRLLQCLSLGCSPWAAQQERVRT
jgi:hypothetical protein